MGRLLVWKIKDLVDVINRILDNDFDCVLFIEGKTGISKSTLAYLLSTKIKFKFKPKRDIYFSRKNVIRALATKKKGVIFADEMINVAHNRDFYETDQKKLIKGLNMYRDSCNLFIGCIPKFSTLDTQLRDLCKIRITVLRRGIALIQTQVPSIYSNDPWDIKNNQKIENKWLSKGKIKPRYSQLTTCRGIFKFNDLTLQQRELYVSIKSEKRNKVFLEGDEVDEPIEKIFYKNLLEEIKTRKITPKEFIRICKIAGKRPEAVRSRVNLYLRNSGEDERFSQLVSINNIKPTKDTLGFNN